MLARLHGVGHAAMRGAVQVIHNAAAMAIFDM